jgi:hypothetical protein
MQIKNFYKYLLIVVFLILLLAIIIFKFVWIKTEINIDPPPEKITFNNNPYFNVPIKGWYFIGKYQLIATKEGFPDFKKEIKVSAKNSKLHLSMVSYKDLFIKSLPKNGDGWNISYSSKYDKFYLQILSGPYEQKLSEAKKYIQSNNLDVNKINIYSWGAKGIQ